MPRGQADCACLQRRRDEGRRNCQGQSRGRAEEAALHGLVRTCSGLGQGFNQLHPPLQSRRGGSLESICGEAPRGPASRRCSLKMAPGEKVTDYLTRAEGIQLDLQEAGEMTSNVIFCAMVVKSFPPTFESTAMVLNFGPRKGYKEMKQNLINFANTRTEPGTDVASTAFHSSGGNSSRKITCFKCQWEGHMVRDCRSKESRACFKSNAKGYLARDCKSRQG